MGFLQCFSVFNDSADWNRLGFLNKISFFPLWLFCLQIFFKEFFHCIIKIKPVILVSKAMSFVVFYNIFHFNATLFQRSNHLITFCLIHPWIVSTLGNKQRYFYLICMKNR